MSRRRWLALGLALAALAAWLGLTRLVGYTADAYVRSDLVAVAAEVAGTVQTVAVADNQEVAAGDLLAVIEPTPYALAVDLAAQHVAAAEAALAVKAQAQATDAASIAGAEAAQTLAQHDFARVSKLATEGDLPQASLDKASDTQSLAADTLAGAEARAAVGAREVEVARVAAAAARAELAIAQYALSRTRITAPVAGHINNLSLRPGAYLAVGQAVVGIVDASAWRVVANFKEDVAAGMAPGLRAWVMLDSDPWRLRPARVQGVGRAIARDPGPAQLLPYVAPTTDWIRLSRRLPVTLLLEDGTPPAELFMGSDARVLFVR